MRILIVEDERKWHEALEEMYERVFHEFAPEIYTCMNKKDALKRLNIGNWDLVSLDIKLGDSKSPDTEDETNNENVLDSGVFDEIKHKNLARYIVLITGIKSDKDIKVLVSGSSHLKMPIITVLPAYMMGMFPGRSLLFQKDRAYDIKENIRSIKAILVDQLDSILRTCGLLNSLEFLSAGQWKIVFRGQTRILRQADNRGYLGLQILARLIKQKGEELYYTDLSPDRVRSLQFEAKTQESDSFTSPDELDSDSDIETVPIKHAGGTDRDESEEAKWEHIKSYKEIAMKIVVSQKRKEPIDALAKELDTVGRFLVKQFGIAPGQLERLQAGLGIRIKSKKGTPAQQRVAKNLTSLFDRLAQEFPEFLQHLATPTRTAKGKPTYSFDKSIKKMTGSGSLKYDPDSPLKWHVQGI